MKSKNTAIKRWLRGLVLLAVVAGGIWFAVARNAHPVAGGGLHVVASYYPLYDFAKQVGGDAVQVRNLTPAGAEPHDYEPSPKALVEAQKAAVFIYNGGSFEPWTDKFVHDYQHTLIKASTGIALEAGEAAGATPGTAGGDPHFWLDPVLAQHIVNTIRDGFSQADPAHKEYYAHNAARYNAQLAQLHTEFQRGLRACRLHTIIASHQAFGYVASRYHFTVQALTGLSPDEEPSAGRLAVISEHVKREGIGYIFFEGLVSPRLAATIAQETGAKTLALDPIEGLRDEAQQQGQNYLSLQRQNLANLRTALACQ